MSRVQKLLDLLRSNFTASRALKLLGDKELTTEQAREVLVISRGNADNLQIYNGYFKFLARMGDIEEIEKENTLAATHEFYPTLQGIIMNCMVEAYAVKGKVEEALITKDKMKPFITIHASTYLSILHSLILSSSPSLVSQSSSILSEMRLSNLSFPSSLYSDIASVYGKMGLIKDFESMIENMKLRGIHLDTMTYHSFIHSYSKSQNVEIEEGMKVIEKMKGGIERGVVAYTMLVDAYAQKGMMEEAERIMEKMKENECYPNATTYNIIISAYGKSGIINEVMKWVNIMECAGIHPSFSSFVPLLQYYQNEKDVVKFGEVWDIIKKKELNPVGRKYIEIITNLMQVLEGTPPLQVLKREGNKEGMRKLFSSVLKWLGENGELEECEMVIEDMIINGINLREETAELIQSIFSSHGEREKGNGLITRFESLLSISPSFSSFYSLTGLPPSRLSTYLSPKHPSSSSSPPSPPLSSFDDSSSSSPPSPLSENSVSSPAASSSPSSYSPISISSSPSPSSSSAYASSPSFSLSSSSSSSSPPSSSSPSPSSHSSSYVPPSSPFSPPSSSPSSSSSSPSTRKGLPSFSFSSATNITPDHFNHSLRVLLAKQNLDACLIVLDEMMKRGLKPEVEVFNAIVDEYSARMEFLRTVRTRLIS